MNKETLDKLKECLKKIVYFNGHNQSARYLSCLLEVCVTLDDIIKEEEEE